MTQLGDEILIAYADGELVPSQTRLVEGVMAADGLTRDRFQRRLEVSQRLSGAFSSMLEAEAKLQAAERLSRPSPPPVQTEALPASPRSRSLLVPAMASGVVLVTLGALGGYLAGNGSDGRAGDRDPFSTADFWNRGQEKAEEARSKALLQKIEEPVTTAATPRPPKDASKKWFEQVAARHRRDAPTLFEQYTGKSRNRELALFQFSRTDMTPSLIPVLKDEELVFVGASPVRIDGKPYARLTYRDLGNGAVPVGLYVGKAAGGSLTLERGYRDNDNYVRWTQDGRSYMLIGAVPHWRLIVLSVSVQRQLVR